MYFGFKSNTQNSDIAPLNHVRARVRFPGLDRKWIKCVCYIIAMVTCYVMTMTITCSTMTGHIFPLYYFTPSFVSRAQ